MKQTLSVWLEILKLNDMGVFGSKDSKNGILMETLADHVKGINCMVLSDDASMIVTGSEDLTARMWAIKASGTECMGVLR